MHKMLKERLEAMKEIEIAYTNLTTKMDHLLKTQKFNKDLNNSIIILCRRIERQAEILNKTENYDILNMMNELLEIKEDLQLKESPEQIFDIIENNKHNIKIGSKICSFSETQIINIRIENNKDLVYYSGLIDAGTIEVFEIK